MIEVIIEFVTLLIQLIFYYDVSEKYVSYWFNNENGKKIELREMEKYIMKAWKKKWYNYNEIQIAVTSLCLTGFFN